MMDRLRSLPDGFAPVLERERATPAGDPATRLGWMDKVYVIWLAGSSCDGCSVGVTGATQPRLEQLLTGAVPGLPRVVLLHTDFSTESGDEYTTTLHAAEQGELDAPYVVTFEGSVPDEATAGDGFWSGLGADPHTGRQLTTGEWLRRLAPGASAVIAIGTCAAFGGVPAAAGNATGAMGVPDWLGPDARPASGMPLVMIPGCAPPGDNYVETLGAILLFLNGLAPLPEFDSMGRPAWLYDSTVHARCSRVDDYLSGLFAGEHGEPGCLVELGCCGPVAVCNIAERGMIEGEGGCMKFGGICIGCTMPGFPDAYLTPARHPDTRSSVIVSPGAFRRRMHAYRNPSPDPSTGSPPEPAGPPTRQQDRPRPGLRGSHRADRRARRMWHSQPAAGRAGRRLTAPDSVLRGSA